MLVYSAKFSNRLRYAISLVLGDTMGAKYDLCNNIAEFSAYKGPKLSYGEEPICDEVFIYQHPLLLQRNIQKQDVNIFHWRGLPAFFATSPRFEIPFDLLAASFYLATRYEEYLPFEADEHGRFQAKDSIACKNNFIEKPIINNWVEHLKKILLAKYPELSFKKRSYQYISTFDIDVAYAYQERGAFRTLAGIIQNLLSGNLPQIKEKFNVLFNRLHDPYNTFDLQCAIQDKYNLEQIYFCLVGDYAPFDKNISLENSRKLQALFKTLADSAQIGLHPSYLSNFKTKNLKIEQERLSKLLKLNITKSRQHYLKLSFPETYRRLLDVGISEEYSMGYADEIGFRASLCTPFCFYDLPLEQSTNLKIFPFAVMDGTLKDYMQLKPSAAIEKIKNLVDEVRKVKGTFISVWHNQSLDESSTWQGWLRVYTEMVEYASKN